MFKSIFLSIFLLLVFSYPVYAYEEFFPDGDVYNNKYYDALGYTIGELPANSVCPNCIQYDESEIVGITTGKAINEVGLFDITERFSGVGLKRKSGIADRVALPPGSLINFVYWGFNDTGSNVEINRLKVFLSRSNPTDGNIVGIVDVSGTYESISVNYFSYSRNRSGYVKTYDGPGIVQYSGATLKPFVLDGLYVRSPLVFRTWKYVENDNGFDAEISVENVSEYRFENVVFEHMGYIERYTFDPLEEHIFKYSIESDIEDLELASISVLNSHEECVVYSEFQESMVIEDSTPLVGIRVSGLYVRSYFGSRVLEIPLEKSFCIKRIPYVLYSGDMKILEDSKEENINIAETQENLDTPEIKGLEKLPQTSEVPDMFPLFAVVGSIFLWYYLCRRFKHES